MAELVRLTTVDNSIDAHMLQNKLEREGIFSYLLHENFTNLFPHYFGILGSGIQIMVLMDDLSKAREIAHLDEHKITCPNCGSDQIDLKNKFTAGMIALFLGALVGNLLNQFRCKVCGTEFKK